MGKGPLTWGKRNPTTRGEGDSGTSRLSLTVIVKWTELSQLNKFPPG